jgi:threonine synthase
MMHRCGNRLVSSRSPAAHYVDPATGARFPLAVPRWRSDAGGPLMLSELPGLRRSDIDTSVRSLWRYRRAFAVEIAQPVTLGEGLTPLVRSRFRGITAHFKLEWFAPSGSFKDRGASVMVSALRHQGITHILEDSSGNGGAAIATYAAAAGMRAKILTPASTQPGKLVQMRALGAEVELVPGSRQATADEAVRQADRIFYASHNWQPFFLEGTKTLAYELWEDLGFKPPDNVIIPTGAGSNVLGCDIGFGELLRAGEIERLPRLFAVQPENCAPIDACFKRGASALDGFVAKPTIAEGTAIARPVRLRENLAAIRRSGGATVTVSEEEIVAATLALPRETGLYAEPTSAAAAAALSKLAASGAIAAGDVTVVVLTGTGLKATPRIGELIGTAG